MYLYSIILTGDGCISLNVLERKLRILIISTLCYYNIIVFLLFFLTVVY